MFKLIGTLCLVLVIALSLGCAAPGPKSKALQVTDASGLELRDVRRDRLESAEPGKPTVIPGAVLTVGTATGDFSTPPGVSQGMGTTILAAGLVVSMLDTKNEALSHLLAWMPKSEASSPEEASNLMSDTLADSIADSMPGHTVSWGVNEFGETQFFVRGPSCSPECVLGMTGLDSPKEVDAPDFLGGYASYSWTISSWSRGAWWTMRIGPEGQGNYPVTRADFAPEDKLDFYRRVSDHLPSWAYLYIAPSKHVVPFPLVYHQGQALLFVQPPKDGVPDDLALRSE